MISSTECRVWLLTCHIPALFIFGLERCKHTWHVHREKKNWLKINRVFYSKLLLFKIFFWSLLPVWQKQVLRELVPLSESFHICLMTTFHRVITLLYQTLRPWSNSKICSTAKIKLKIAFTCQVPVHVKSSFVWLLHNVWTARTVPYLWILSWACF